MSDAIAAVVAAAGAEEAARLAQLEDRLRGRVTGQDHVLNVVSDVVRSARAGLSNPNRPQGVFLFLGPTGVGKTELARALAGELFGGEKNMIRLDMSDYIEEHSVAKLIGSPPGYKDSDEGGRLTNAVRSAPYSILLLDEIEKAHPRVFDLFLQVFDEGRLVDARGKQADFRHSIIILTSNLVPSPDVAFGLQAFRDNGRTPVIRSKEQTIQYLKSYFRSEFLNRIDEILTFVPLTRASIHAIIDKHIQLLRFQLAEKKISIDVLPEVYDAIAQEGYSEEFGVRNLQRVLERMIIRPLAQELLSGIVRSGDQIQVAMSGAVVSFNPSRSSTPTG